MARIHIVSGLAVVLALCAALQAGLVAEYDFNSSLTQDSSGSGYHATNSGATWATGPFGKTAVFDGINSYIQLPSNTLLNNLQSGDFTLMGWTKAFIVPPTTGSANTAHFGIVEKAGYHSGLKYENTSRFSTDLWRTGPTNVNLPSSGTYGPAAWHHVAGTYSTANGTVDLYVDGQHVGTKSFTPGLASYNYGSTPWRIGIANPGAGSYRWPMSGMVDEVRIYDEKLSGPAIAQVYDSYAGADTRNIWAGYRRDFASPAPAAGWSYLWNKNGPIGDSDNYAALLWDNGSYQTVQNGSYPDSPPGRYIALHGTGGHPGQGTTNPEQPPTAYDRFAIAAYTVNRDGLFEIQESFLVKPSTAFGPLDLLVHVNDAAPLITRTVPVGGAITFDGDLGHLSPGDTIYFAVGPNTHDYNDAFTWDFNIVYTEIPEPLTLAALLLGGSAVGGYVRRRRR